MGRPHPVIRQIEEERRARLAREASVVESSDLLSVALKREKEAEEKAARLHEARRNACRAYDLAEIDYQAAVSARKRIERESTDNA